MGEIGLSAVDDTFPLRSGRSFSVNFGFPGKVCDAKLQRVVNIVNELDKR